MEVLRRVRGAEHPDTLLSMNNLGSCKGSTGPASAHPETGEPWRLDFPELSLEDVAAATQQVVGHLGIERLCTVMGPSMGGMTCLGCEDHLLDNGFGIVRMFLQIFSDIVDSIRSQLIYTSFSRRKVLFPQGYPR